MPDSVRESVQRGEMWTDVLSLLPPEASAARIATGKPTETWVIAAFGGGLFAGLGTAAILIFNGVMLGAIAAYCGRHGLLTRLLEFMARGAWSCSSHRDLRRGGVDARGRALEPRRRSNRGPVAKLQARGRRAALLVLGCAPFLAG